MILISLIFFTLSLNKIVKMSQSENHIEDLIPKVSRSKRLVQSINKLLKW